MCPLVDSDRVGRFLRGGSCFPLNNVYVGECVSDMLGTTHSRALYGAHFFLEELITSMSDKPLSLSVGT
jgi:hypothetical protein